MKPGGVVGYVTQKWFNLCIRGILLKSSLRSRQAVLDEFFPGVVRAFLFQQTVFSKLKRKTKLETLVITVNCSTASDREEYLFFFSLCKLLPMKSASAEADKTKVPLLTPHRP